VAVAVIVLGAVLSGYGASLNDDIAALDGQLDASEAGRNKEQEQILLDLDKQTAAIRPLYVSKPYWSRALDALEKLTQSGITFTQLSTTLDKGLITFRASATSWSAVARQIAAFAGGTGISDIRVNSVESKAQGIEFGGELTISTKELLQVSPTPKPTSP
jgi:hypothetical protein